MKVILGLAGAVMLLTGCGSPGHERHAESRSGLAEGTVIIDCRTPEEYAAGHVSGTTNVPVGELAERIDEVVPDKSTPVAVHCHSGARARTAAELLVAKGYQVKDLGSLQNARAVVERK